jgi:heme a synthase
MALVWALCVLMAGAYTRLSNAGLGCPDWPGCYGHWTVTQKSTVLLADTTERIKAHIEMGHRYMAGVLGLLLVLLVIFAWNTAYRGWGLALLALLIVQASLGRWTVTYRLTPVVVLMHLGMGFLTTTLLWIGRLAMERKGLFWNKRVLGVVALLVFQIFLGGWLSVNYAGLACPDFPGCGGERGCYWQWPVFEDAFLEGWALKPGLVPHGVAALQMIQMVHRIGALIVGIMVGSVAYRLWQRLRYKEAVLLGGLLSGQLLLGFLNVYAQLPILVAVLHHVMAILLLLALIRVALL